MKNGFRLLFFISLFLVPQVSDAGGSYKSLLKEWTRQDRVYVLDNLEARLIWHATYLSDPFREARRSELAKLYEWSDEEKKRGEREDRSEEEDFDSFFLGVYSGSSEWPEIGKDEGKWKIVLEVKGQKSLQPVRMERLPVTEVERALYPYLDKWSRAFLVKFPKVIHPDDSFRLRMTGFPARSELVWK